MVKKIVSIVLLLGILSLLAYSQQEERKTVFFEDGTIGIVENGMLFVPETGLMTPVIDNWGTLTLMETGEVVPYIESIMDNETLEPQYSTAIQSDNKPIITGNDLYQKMRPIENLKELANLNTTEYCYCWEVMGFIESTIRNSKIVSSITEKTSSPFELPADCTYRELYSAIYNYLDNHPGKRNQLATSLTIKALKKEFPKK